MDTKLPEKFLTLINSNWHTLIASKPRIKEL